jgi:phosphoribosyl 1,2-cyclic phosphodiesterase
MRPDYPRFFSTDEQINVNGFTVFPVLKNHDAAEPCSFRIEYGGRNIGVFTDIGEACDNVKSNIKICDGLFLESNYDERMLWDGQYPFYLKRRIASELGHLSNDQAFDLLNNSAGENLRIVILSHLSRDNNTPEKARDRMAALMSRFEIKLASRYEPSEVYKL